MLAACVDVLIACEAMDVSKHPQSSVNQRKRISKNKTSSLYLKCLHRMFCVRIRGWGGLEQPTNTNISKSELKLEILMTSGHLASMQHRHSVGPNIANITIVIELAPSLQD